MCLTNSQVHKLECDVTDGSLELSISLEARYGWQAEAGRDVCAKDVCEVCSSDTQHAAPQ